MTYRDLLKFTKEHPNCFFNWEEHEKEARYRYKYWVYFQNQVYRKK